MRETGASELAQMGIAGRGAVLQGRLALGAAEQALDNRVRFPDRQ